MNDQLLHLLDEKIKDMESKNEASINLSIEKFRPLVAAASKCVKLQINVRKMLAVMGQPTVCKSCNAPITFVTTKAGKQTPYTPEAVSHFADCPDANKFRRG